MPVTRLLVEGNLDVEILGTLNAGSTVVIRGGSKNSLGPRTQSEREAGATQTCYVRDRDYDYFPPGDLTQPVVDRQYQGSILGWRWCRHELENYLIDPKLVVAATGWERAEYEAALHEAATRIRCYQAARWAVGTARRALPPHHDLDTRPLECSGHDFRLPADLAEGSCSQWACSHAAAYLTGVTTVLRAEALLESLQARLKQFSEEFLQSCELILAWFSGKDLIAALQDWLQAKQVKNPGEFRAALRDWVRAQPTCALGHLPEWQRLCDALHARDEQTN